LVGGGSNGHFAVSGGSTQLNRGSHKGKKPISLVAPKVAQEETGRLSAHVNPTGDKRPEQIIPMDEDDFADF
jgi:hypothetical protein